MTPVAPRQASSFASRSRPSTDLGAAALAPLSTAPGVMGGGSGLPPAHKTAISCWLVPPEKPQAELSALVQRLANENGLPAFDVHITIIGDVLGEHCSSVAEAIERLQLLAHAGAVPCRFASIECFPPWNQSLMAVAEESPERQHGQTRHPGSGRADHPRPEAPSRVRTAAIWAPEQSYCLGPRSAIPGASPRRRYRCRLVPLRFATQELCRLQRLAQQTFYGTPEAEARVEWAMPVGKPHCSLASHLTTTTLSTPLAPLSTL